MGVLQVLTRIATVLTFTSITILQNNCVTADLLGTANGMAMAIGCCGR